MTFILIRILNTLYFLVELTQTVINYDRNVIFKHLVRGIQDPQVAPGGHPSHMRDVVNPLGIYMRFDSY